MRMKAGKNERGVYHKALTFKASALATAHALVTKRFAFMNVITAEALATQSNAATLLLTRRLP